MNGWLDSPIESFKASYNDAIAKWQDALTALDGAYNEFTANMDYARADPALSAQWDDLSGKVSILQATINGVGGTVSSVQDFFTSIGNGLGLTDAKPSGMGFAFVIPWAAVGLVTAAVAGVWLIVNQLRAFNVDVANQKIAAQNILNSQNGQPLIPYLDLSSSGPDGSLFSGLSDTAKWIAFGVVGYFALKLLEGKRHGHA